MRCKGNYTRGFFHNWGKWQTTSAHRTWAWADGTTSRIPMTIQYRECSRCGKRQIEELG